MALVDVMEVIQAVDGAGRREQGNVGGFRRLWQRWKRPETVSDARVQGQLELPVPGEQSEQHAIKLQGWAFSAEAPVEFIDVEYNSHKFQRLKPLLPRKDVARALNEPRAAACGFSGLISLLGLPPVGEIEVVAWRKDQVRVPLATVKFRRQQLRPAYMPRRQPLLLQGLGRSGTTWVMRLLREHPGIVVAGDYPYEIHAAQCWLGLVKGLHVRAQQTVNEALQSHARWLAVAPAARQTLEDALDRLHLGTAPLADILGQAQVQIDDFYQQEAEKNGRLAATYFSEKAMTGASAGVTAEAYTGFRDLFLVRDFRDVFCSIQSFNAKRNFADFGRQLVESDEEHIRLMADDTQRFLGRWRSRQKESILVHYEDLILRPAPTLRRLFDGLGLDAAAPLIDAVLARARQDTPELQEHRTSGSPTESVGRWRQHLPAAQRKLIWELMGETLQAFGYGPDGITHAA